MIWFAIQTHPARETKARDKLQDHGIEAALPMEEIRYRPRGLRAWEKTNRPLIPGYVFVGFPGDIPWSTLNTIRPGLLRGFVGSCGIPRPIHPECVARLMRLTAKPETPSAPFSIGQRVRVADGGFAGLAFPVLEIAEARARGLLQLFGSEREIWFPVDLLEAA